MAEISKITLPSGNTYEIKDATARQMISGGVSFIVAWNGTDTPVAANIPKGVKAGSVTGTLEAADAQAGAFYLVKSSTTPSSETLDVYEEYAVVGSATKTWEKLGDTQLNLTDVVTGVELTKQTDVVLGEATTFTNGSSSVSFTGGTTDTFVKSVSVTKGDKLVTTTVPNVTGNTSVSASKINGNTSATANKSTWSFTMGSGDAAETLVIGGGNGSDVTATNTTYTDVTASNTTLGTAKTVATGETSSTGTGSAVVSDVTVGSSASAVTSVGTGTAAAQKITVGTNDKVTVLKNTTDVNVTKGNA